MTKISLDLIRSLSHVIALALVMVPTTIGAFASTDSMPSGPAAQAILQWFTTDLSLGCNDQQGNDSACTVKVNLPEFKVYYGNSTGSGPQADALAFVSYGPSPGGNMMSLGVAYFHDNGSKYRFIKIIPNVLGIGPIKGTTVQFLPGKATFSMAVLQGNDSHCCPSGRANYTEALNPTSPTLLTPSVGGNAQDTYHAPRTPAELALAKVHHIKMSIDLWPDLSTGTGPYATLFTPQLSRAVGEADREEAQAACGGDRTTAGVCGLDFDPIFCAQDYPEAPLYRTISAKGDDEAIIAFAWDGESTDHARYRLVKIDGAWKLDGIECASLRPGPGDKYGDDSIKFNVQPSGLAPHVSQSSRLAPHVRRYENIDASGNDRGSWIRAVSSAACESICLADSGCAGYTYNRSRATCIPKNTVVKLKGSSEPAVTGVVEGR